jgi:hypothetical protein
MADRDKCKHTGKKTSSTNSTEHGIVTTVTCDDCGQLLSRQSTPREAN